MIKKEENLFIGDKGENKQGKPVIVKDTQKFGAKVKSTLDDLVEDTKTSVEDAAEGITNSIEDIFNGKQNSPGSQFIVRDKSIANRHKNAISDILNDTFNGNLFDAGISAINLANTGTKWKTIMDQNVDKDAYAFKYFYHYDKLYPDKNTNGVEYEQSEHDIIANNQTDLHFLDLIEDPTILGYSMKIDYNNSPLFKIDKNSCLDFIEKFSPSYGELAAASLYREEFLEGIQKIFVSPESQSAIDGEFKDPLKKNHYINSIEGLEKLDNPYVDFSEENINASGQRDISEHLVITLQEDVRMYVNRLAFLYRNLSWSYNMGKKLIPENLLRFNLYIKIADNRSFTRGNNTDDELRNAMRDDYSRVIYELKDCEFYFDSSLNPSNLGLAGFSDVNRSLSQLKIKIKYRKVNRIFYSKMFSSTFVDFLIGDKFHQPNTQKSYEDLQAMGFLNIKKRDASTNNIAVTTSLNERIDRLKNKGLFTEDDDDSALTRFAKGIGNNAVKAGFEVVDEGLQNVKQKLNSVSPFGGSLSDALSGSVNAKTKDLGRVYDISDEGVIKTKTESGNYISISGKYVYKPGEPIQIPNNLTNDVGTIKGEDGIEKSKHYLYIVTPPEQFDIKFRTNDTPKIDPSDASTLDSEKYNYNIANPVEDLHPTLDQVIDNPDNDLHPTLDQVIVNPDNDLHPTLDQVIKSPGENINSPFKKFIRKELDPNKTLNDDDNDSRYKDKP